MYVVRPKMIEINTTKKDPTNAEPFFLKKIEKKYESITIIFDHKKNSITNILQSVLTNKSNPHK
jgi:hypothetical protein